MSAVQSISLALLLFSASMCIAADDASESPARQEVGDRVTNFDLSIVGGDGYIELSEQYKQGPVAVIVLRGYPGYQCPLCSQQVSTLRNRAKALAKSFHRVILVYPGEADQLQRHAEDFLGSRALPDPLVMVRDDDLEMVKSWGLRWNAPRETAYPAAYIIDRNGRVRWSKVSDNHAGRASVEELLRELRKLKPPA